MEMTPTIECSFVRRWNCSHAFNPSKWLGIHGIYVNSSIMDEEFQRKNNPFKIKGQFIPILLH